MNLLKKILGKLSGLKFNQEYLCLAKESFDHPFTIYLIVNGKIVDDITKSHNFIGYSPVIFALSLSQSLPEKISLAFCKRAFHPNEKFSKKDAVALFDMKKINAQSAGDKNIFYFEGIHGRHWFLSSFHQFIIQLQNKWYQKKVGNIFLPGNLYKQVQIAYAVPRNISLITVNQNDNYNLFPTDLHGAVGNDHYIISLRHGGKACAQVMQSKQILLTQVEADFYKTVYSLGKNHMQELKSIENFPFTNLFSSHLHLPVPQSALLYRELELVADFIHGIHRILLFKSLYQQSFQVNSSPLFHIHNVYASWRYNNRLEGNYLLR